METKPVNFRFTNFFVQESHIVFNEQADYELNIEINPSGVVNNDLFQLHLNVIVSDVKERMRIDVKTVADFEFDETIDILNNTYFTVNAPAIVFPFIRAYIANLTTQSGINTILLPTFNLSGLADILKENIVINQ